jgi:hypothetical protein
MLPLLLLAVIAGCDYGLSADEEASEFSPFVTPLIDNQAIPTLVPVVYGSDDMQESDEFDTPDDSASYDQDPTTTGICIDMSGPHPRAIPCLIPRSITQPRSHDDPDPWKPVVLPAVH